MQTSNEDPLVAEMIRQGFVTPNEDGTYKLTDRGSRALKKQFETDPEYYAKIFPEWVKKEWLH